MPDLSYCRRRILEILGDDELSVEDVTANTGRLHTNVSRDLRILYAAGLVTRRRMHPFVFYRQARTQDGVR